MSIFKEFLKACQNPVKVKNFVDTVSKSANIIENAHENYKQLSKDPKKVLIENGPEAVIIVAESVLKSLKKRVR